jgi:hypothetical protein
VARRANPAHGADHDPIGSKAGGETAAVLYTVVATCKHLQIDPMAYLTEALVGLFALGEKPSEEQLQQWLPDVWLLRRARETPQVQAPTGVRKGLNKPLAPSAC